MNLATEAVALSGQNDEFLLEVGAVTGHASVDMLHDFPVRGRLQLRTDLFGLSHHDGGRHDEAALWGHRIPAGDKGGVGR